MGVDADLQLNDRAAGLTTAVGMTLPPTQKSLLPTTGEGHYLQPRRGRLGRDVGAAPSRCHDGTVVAGRMMQGQSQQVTSSVEWLPVPTLGYDAQRQRRMDYFVSRWRSFLDQVEDNLSVREEVTRRTATVGGFGA